MSSRDFCCVECKHIHCAEAEHARDGKLTTSGQVEFPDLDVGQSILQSVWKDSVLDFRDWEQDGQHIRNDVGNRIAKMDSLCRETFTFLRRRAGPVCIEVGPAKEE